MGKRNRRRKARKKRQRNRQQSPLDARGSPDVHIASRRSSKSRKRKRADDQKADAVAAKPIVAEEGPVGLPHGPPADESTAEDEYEIEIRYDVEAPIAPASADESPRPAEIAPNPKRPGKKQRVRTRRRTLFPPEAPDEEEPAEPEPAPAEEIPRPGGFWSGALYGLAIVVPAMAGLAYLLGQADLLAKSKLENTLGIAATFAGLPAALTYGGIARRCTRTVAFGAGLLRAATRGASHGGLAGVALTILIAVPVGGLPEAWQSWWPIGAAGLAVGVATGAVLGVLVGIGVATKLADRRFRRPKP